MCYYFFLNKNVLIFIFNSQFNISFTANKKSCRLPGHNIRPRIRYIHAVPNNTSTYVHCHSNHPFSILCNIPEAINTRLSNISSDEKSFTEAIPPYQEALRKSGYNHQLKFNPSTPKKDHNRKGHRNNIWFNPSYNSNVSTNIGKCFLKSVDSYFCTWQPNQKDRVSYL